MADKAEDLQAAIAEAVGETKLGSDTNLEQQLASFDEELAEGEEEVVEDSTATAEPPSTAKDSETVSGLAEGEDPFTDEELATAKDTDSYWGTDLTGVPVEQKAAILRHFAQQDSTIQKLQAKLAEPLEVPAASDEPAAEDVTDEQLLQVMGIDPEDFSIPDALKKVVVTQARNQLALEDQVAALTSTEQARSAQTLWNTELDQLEATYGKLPGTREEVLRYAMREEVVTPADLYFKLTAPVKREVESLAAKARREAAKRVQSGGLKPRSSSAEPAPVQPGMSVREAVKAAAMAAQKETGHSWKTAMKRVLTAQPGAE